MDSKASFSSSSLLLLLGPSASMSMAVFDDGEAGGFGASRVS